MRRFKDKRLFEREESRFIWAKLRNEHGKIKPLSTRCTAETAASLFCDEWERKAADPNYKAASETCLDDAVSDFLAEYRRRGVSQASYSIAETKLGHFARLWGHDWPMARVSNELVLQYIDRRESEGVKPYTVKKELGALKQMLEWARFRGRFQRDLATVMPPHYSGRHKPKSRTPSREEVVLLLQAMSASRGAHIAFIVATGARWGESVRACRSDVDVENLVVMLRGSKTELARGTVPITGITWDFIVYALEHAPGKAPMFDRWSSGSYFRDIHAACKRAGIEPLSPNDLRRAFGTWHRQAIIKHGGGKESAAELSSILLRHSTDTLAQTTYARLTGADIGPALRAFAPVPILTAAPAQTAPSDSNKEHETVEIQHARPDSNRRHSASKAFSPSTSQERRSVGNKLGHSRRRAGASVSLPYSGRAMRLFLAALRFGLAREPRPDLGEFGDAWRGVVS
jgi:integrase